MMVHTEQAALAFNDFNIGVGFCCLLRLILEIGRFPHHEVAEAESNANQSDEGRKVRTCLRKPTFPIINAECK